MSATAAAREPSTSQLLEALADERPEGADHDRIGLEEIVQRFGRRGFGVLTLIATLPAFLPLPAGAGAVSGPLVALMGLQMMLGLRRPWLPGRLRRHGIPRQRIRRFSARIGPWLRRIERLVRPRAEGLTRQLACHVLNGLVLLLLGILIALPIPLTNYPLGLLILLCAVALIERDGVLLALCWLATLAVAGFLGLAGGGALAWARTILG